MNWMHTGPPPQSSRYAFVGLGIDRSTTAEPLRRLHREQPRLRRGIGLEPLIPIEMIGRDVEQHRDVAVEALGQVDLVARQFEDIDAAFGERVLRQDRQADVAAHQARHARGLEDVVDQRGGGRLAVGAGDADDLVRRKVGAGAGEQFDVADDLDPGLARALRDRVAVERQAGGDDDAVEAGEVGCRRSSSSGDARRAPRAARRLIVIPRRHPRPARQQRVDRRPPAAGEAEDGVMLAGEGGAGDHLSLRVERPASARMKLMIQKRITTVGSLQPRCSK